MGEIELCRLFSLSEEFKFLVVRQEEKVRTRPLFSPDAFLGTCIACTTKRIV
jgi:hypothetical protein